jgi:hypothetical protein
MGERNRLKNEPLARIAKKESQTYELLTAINIYVRPEKQKIL